MSLGVVSNKCTIVSGEGLITAASITGGVNSGKESNDGVTVDTSDMTHIVFDAQVKRKGQSSVADDWNAALDNSALHMDSYQWLGSNPNVPGDLNFYFPIALTIDGQDYDLLLGQGSYGTTNNWWIGSLNMLSVVQAQIGKFGLVSGTFLLHKQGKLTLLPSVNSVVFNSASSLTITNLLD